MRLQWFVQCSQTPVTSRLHTHESLTWKAKRTVAAKLLTWERISRNVPGEPIPLFNSRERKDPRKRHSGGTINENENYVAFRRSSKKGEKWSCLADCYVSLMLVPDTGIHKDVARMFPGGKSIESFSSHNYDCFCTKVHENQVQGPRFQPNQWRQEWRMKRNIFSSICEVNNVQGSENFTNCFSQKHFCVQLQTQPHTTESTWM